MTLPETIIKEGVQAIKINCNNETFGKMIIHDKGIFKGDMTGASPKFYYTEIVQAQISHEHLGFLNYNGQPCNKSKSYSYNKCKQDCIHKVHSM